MKIVVAPNCFRESLSAVKAAQSIAEGVGRVFPEASIVQVPIADGGDGTMEVLVNHLGGTWIEEEVVGPLGDPVSARIGILGDGFTAVIEMAEASGINLVPPGRRDPMRATTYGTGQLIKASLNRGCKRLVVGVGGSATVDGGAGMAQALGARLLDGRGDQIERGGGGLGKLDRIDVSGIDGRLADVEVIVACDVDNFLLGDEGSARMFGPQKGATEDQVVILEENLAHYAAVIWRDLGRDIASVPFTGAAGGLAAGLLAFLDARLELGVDAVLGLLDIERHLRGADLLITGEGKLDRQTIHGKAPIGVARLARKHGVPVVAIAGCVSQDADVVLEYGIDGFISIAKYPMSLDESMRKAADLIADASESAMRLVRIGLHLGG